MCQQHHVVTLAAAGWPAPPDEIAALTNTKHAAQAMDGEFRFRPVDRPIPRSPAISRCVRPLVCTRRTASSSNSFVNRRCCVIEFLIAHRELSTFPKQVQLEAQLKQVPGSGDPSSMQQQPDEQLAR